MADLMRIKYGLWVVMAGFFVVLLVYGIAVWNWKTASDIATVTGSVTGVVGTIVGAFFGVQVGASGKEKAEEERNRAQERALVLAGAIDPQTYNNVRTARADLFGPPQ